LKLDFNLDHHAELRSLKEQILERHQDVQKVEFRSLDGAHIPESERLSELENFPFRIIVNGQFQYVLNLMHDISLSSDND